MPGDHGELPERVRLVLEARAVPKQTFWLYLVDNDLRIPYVMIFRNYSGIPVEFRFSGGIPDFRS